MNKTITLINMTGSFAENKDIAKTIRIEQIIPALEKKQEVIIDFDGIEAVTQSFIHALISDLIRKYGANILNIISFKNCNETVKKIITIVVDYMQESTI